MPRTICHPSSIFSRNIPFRFGLAAAAGLYLLLASLGAATDPWRADEAFTNFVVHLGLKEMWLRILRDVHPPLFYLVLAPWVRLFPEPEFMKSFNLLLGCLVILMGGQLARVLAGSRAGILAALLLATCPQLLHFCQDLRMYPLGLLCELAALYGWLIARQRPRAGWLWCVGGLTGALYTHNHCLIFATALLAAEFLRQAWQRWVGNTAAPRRASEFTWAWTAALATGLIYLPWVPELIHQMHFPFLSTTFDPPTVNDSLSKFFLVSYTLDPRADTAWPGWIPGIAMLGVLPLAAIAGNRQQRESHDARPMRPGVLMILWVALAPILFLLLYSAWRSPIMDMNRHGVLFIPLMLLVAAIPLAEFSRNIPGRTLAGAIVLGLAVNAFAVLAHPRDPDLTAARDTLLAKAPAAGPILTFPLTRIEDRMMWDPLPLYKMTGGNDLGNHEPACTLIVTPGLGLQRDMILNHVQRFLGTAAHVRELFSSYYIIAYAVDGVPDGSLRKFMSYNWWQADSEIITRRLGDWPLDASWLEASLNPLCSPALKAIAGPMNMTAYRVASPETTLELPWPDPPAGGYQALCLGGKLISGAQRRSVKLQVDGQSEIPNELESGPFVLTTLIDHPGKSIKARLSIAGDLARRHGGGVGSLPEGLYLEWASCIRLTSASLSIPGAKGTLVDIGSLGDTIFLRDQFYEREGVPSSNIRWTGPAFALELPVFAGMNFHQAVLSGFLPKQIKDRTVQISVIPRGKPAAHGLTVRQRIDSSEYGTYAFDFGKSLGPGLYRLEVKLNGRYVPQEAGVGNDARELGFYLNTIALQ